MISDAEIAELERRAVDAKITGYSYCENPIRFLAVLERLRQAEDGRDYWVGLYWAQEANLELVRLQRDRIRAETIAECAEACRLLIMEGPMSTHDMAYCDGCQACAEDILALKETP